MERRDGGGAAGRGGIGRALTLALMVASASARAGAEDCAAGAGDAAVTVAAVADDLDLTTTDGRVLRLAGLDPLRATPAAPEGPARARRALEAWLAAGPARVRDLGAGPDRWGRSPVLLFRAGAVADAAAAALVGLGAARARPEAGAEGCWSALLAAEAEARGAGRGLWADPSYAVLSPGDAAGLAAQAGGMALVQGILHVHASRGGLYLALGRDRWGFTGVVSRRDAARFAKRGLDLADYEGTPVRLRGDLDRRFGFRLRVTEPDAIESLEPGSIVEPAAPEEPGRGFARRSRPAWTSSGKR